MNKTKEYKKMALFLVGMVLLKGSFVFLADNYGYLEFNGLFSSVLNVKNIVALTNESRKEAGLGVLKVNSKLQAAAQMKAEDMLKNQYFAHSDPFGKMAWDFMDDAGYNYLFAGENLAMNFNSAEEVNRGWLQSITHKENILSDKYSQIGVGVTAGKFMRTDSRIVVQLFGKPLQANAYIKGMKTNIPKRKERVVALNSSLPAVKGASVERYIAELVERKEAKWMPFVGGIPVKNLLDIIFISILVCGIGVFVWRLKKKAYFKPGI